MCYDTTKRLLIVTIADRKEKKEKRRKKGKQKDGVTL